MTEPITALRGAHAGETLHVVGKGPSLSRISASIFGAGPILTLNEALLNVRRLALPNVLYAMQKDGGDKRRCGEPCRDVCANMLRPIPPERLLVHRPESPDCYADYEPRYIFDNPADFGFRWDMPSAPVAVKLAELWGCARIVFVSLDAAMTGDVRTLEDDRVTFYSDNGYLQIANLTRSFLEQTGIPAEWILPEEHP